MWPLLGAGAALIALALPAGIHRILEGHVGVYWRGGKLLEGVTSPGFHVMMPFITSYSQVQTAVQTDKVMDIPCGTSGGTVIMFERIEVVNQLRHDFVHRTIKNYTVDYDKTWIYDKIHHEINQFCSAHSLQEVYITKFDTLDESLRDALQRDIDQWAPGIKIIAIRVTKPKIPETVRRNYENIEAESTKLQVAMQTQRLVEKEAETERKKAIIEAEKQAAVATINLERALSEKLNAQKMEQVANEMVVAKVRAQADAEFYRAQREAEANRLRITPELIQLEYVRAIANNTKIYFGEKIPSVLLEPGALLGAKPT